MGGSVHTNSFRPGRPGSQASGHYKPGERATKKEEKKRKEEAEKAKEEHEKKLEEAKKKMKEEFEKKLEEEKKKMEAEYKSKMRGEEQAAYDRGFKAGEDSVLEIREQAVAKGRKGDGQEFVQEYHERKPYLPR